MGRVQQERAKRRDRVSGVAVVDVPRTAAGSISEEHRHDFAWPESNENNEGDTPPSYSNQIRSTGPPEC